MANKKILLFSIVLLCVVLVSGCSDENKPKEVFKSYTSNWEKKDFKAMYNRLSSDTKKSVTEDAFITRMNKIYDDIGVKTIAINPGFPEEIKHDASGRVQIPFKLGMDTLAGFFELSYNGTMVKEKVGKGYDWFIEWNEGMIFPDMKPGDTVGIDLKKAVRGEIQDRNGKKLAENGKAANVGIVPGKFKENVEAAKVQIANELGITVEQINNNLKQSWVKDDSFVPLGKISKDENDKIDRLLKVKGVKIQDADARLYPYKDSTAHLIGYLGKVNNNELNNGYLADDLIGRAGLESIFEERLKGENGWEIYIKDSSGKKKNSIAKKEVKNGENIKLTIDADLQSALLKQMSGDSGTATAINPKTGEVLALVSAPSYDPNQFILGLSNKQFSVWNTDPRKPLVPKFTLTYAPGSTFKMITAAIGLKTGAINPEERIDISGKQWQAGPSWGNYYVTRVIDSQKPMDLRDALVYSDNIYFAKAALKIGEESFLREVKLFGIGEDIPFVLPVKKSKITDGGPFRNDIQLADTGYGQGQVEMNVLHMALVYSTLLNSGNLIMPSLEMKCTGDSIKMWHENVISPQTADILLKDLIQVVEDQNGTAKDARIQGLRIAGKTGTAELKSTKDDIQGKENGWFTAFNADNPKLLIAMMIEDVKEKYGSHYVTPKVKNVMDQFAR